MNFIHRSMQGFAGADITDANYNSVVLHLRGDGSNGATNNLAASADLVPYNQDASANAFTVSPNGNPQPNVFHPFQDGYYSVSFNGTTDYLTIPAGTTTFGTGDFTIELWVYTTSLSAAQVLVDTRSGTGTVGLQISIQTTGQVQVLDGASTTVLAPINSAFYLTTNTWSHVALVRASGVLSLYIGGILAQTATVTTNYTGNTTYIGRNAASAANYVAGYISNLRISSAAVYSNVSFAVPTASLSFLSPTSVLICASERYRSRGNLPITVTVNGTPSITTFEPWGFRTTGGTVTQIDQANLSSGYSSTYLNGTTDFLTLPVNNPSLFLGSANFTFEAWVYRSSGTGTATIFAGQNDLATVAGSSYVFYLSSTATSDVYIGSTSYSITSPNPAVGVWSHVAWVRNGGTFTSYLNGVQVGNRTDLGTGSVNLGSTTYAPVIGALANTTSLLTGYISNLRIVRGLAVYTGAFTVPTAPLTLTQTAGTNISAITTSQTVFLLAGTTSGNNGTFVDSSTNAFAVTRSGSVSQSAVSPFYGNYYSNYFNGSTDYLTTSYSTNMSGDFTVELFSFPTSSSQLWLVGTTNTSSFDGILIQSSQKVACHRDGVATDLISNDSVVLNSWNYIVWTRASNVERLWLNGVYQGQRTQSTAYFPFNRLGVCAYPGQSYWYAGYMNNVRILSSALYTSNSNITTPTAPLTLITNTILLTCQSNRFLDTSTNALTITTTGTPRVDLFIPFAQSYAAATQGGSAYFSGADYLSAPNNTLLDLGSGDYTIEGWWYFTDTSNQAMVSKYTAGAGSGGYVVQYQANTLRMVLNANNTDNVYTFAWTPVAYTWNHVAITRSGTSGRAFINGVQIGSTTTFTTSNTAGATTLQIGSTHTVSELTRGYATNIRIVKGTALYTANFTPSTTPLTAVANTQLLLNTQNFNTYDLSRFNHIASVATAVQNPASPIAWPVSTVTTTATNTAMVSYGGGYFNGSTDYLTVPANTAVTLGTGDFTIEFWFYMATSQTGNLFDQRSTATQVTPVIYLNSSVLIYYVNGGAAITGSTVTTSQWNHVAVCRSGSNTKMFLNGTQTGSTLADSNNYVSAPIGIGAYPASGTSLFNGYISNVRIIKGTAVYTLPFTPGTAPAAAVTNTSLLTLQTNGGANNSGIRDASLNNFRIARNGNVATGTFTPYTPDGYSSNYFGGFGNYISAPYNAAFNFGTGDFSVECFAYAIDAGRGNDALKYGSLVGGGLASNLTDIWSTTILISGGVITQFTMGQGASDIITASGLTISINTWHHYVACRTGTTLSLFIDGTRVATTTFNTAINTNSSGIIVVAQSPYGGTTFINWLQGYVSNVRIIKGTHPYNASSTSISTPTAPITATANTSLLTCASNRFADKSTNALAITASGTPSVQPWSPFVTGISYDPGTRGGSAYFDGSGDYLNVAYNSNLLLNATTSTIEGWYYLNAAPGGVGSSTPFFVQGTTTAVSSVNGNSNFWCFADVTNLYFGGGGVGTTYISVSKNVLPILQWFHLAVVITSGTSAVIYVNGSSVASGTIDAVGSSTSYSTQIGLVWTGGGAGTANYLNGYASNFRIVKGTAVYTANFTPPTAPLTAVANTQFLLNFTNSAIYDSAAKNNLESVGNAQISTVVKKYGSASLYFDGTGDYLYIPNNVNLQFVTGTYTVEFWINMTSFSGQNTALLDFRTVNGATGGAIQIYVTSTGIVTVYGGSSTATLLITAGSAISTGSWTHIALTRDSSNNTRLFINGTQSGSTASDSTSYGLGAAWIGTIASGNNYLTGYIDDLRITKGLARYTANFTPTATSFPTR